MGLEHYIGRSTTVVILSGKAIGGKLTVSNENNDVGYFTFEESKSMMKLKNFRDRLVRCTHEEQNSIFYRVINVKEYLNLNIQISYPELYPHYQQFFEVFHKILSTSPRVY